MPEQEIHLIVTGASGQLGTAFRQISKQVEERAWSFDFADRYTLDLCDKDAISHKLKQGKYNYCINCAAYTRVDEAEKEREAAFALNARAVKHLAKACQQNNTRLIHFSTDYVYDSGQTTPYREDDPLNPRSIYAQSKLEGEQYALSENEQTIILRTSWLFSPFGKNFYHSMIQLGSEREELGVVYDQVGTPTSALHLAKAVLHLIKKIEEGLTNWQGIYNFSQEGVCSWYDFAVRIMQEEKLPCRVLPIRTEAFPRPAPRPAFSVMDKQKFRQTFEWAPLHWTEALRMVSLQRQQMNEPPDST